MRSNPRSEEVIEIGKRIRDIRTNKKMSQADLADKANISLSQVSDIETASLLCGSLLSLELSRHCRFPLTSFSARISPR